VANCLTGSGRRPNKAHLFEIEDASNMKTAGCFPAVLLDGGFLQRA
jgi:hypothetical protein